MVLALSAIMLVSGPASATRVLLVDEDGFTGSSEDTAQLAAVQAAGVTVSVSSGGVPPSLADLQAVDAVVWYFGSSFPSSATMSRIGEYIGAGGRILLAGNYVAIAGWSSSQKAMLGLAGWVLINPSSTFTLDPVPGSPIAGTGSLSTTLFSTYLAKTLPGAVTDYAFLSLAALYHVQTGTSRVVFMAFPLSNLNSGDQAPLYQRALGWLVPSSSLSGTVRDIQGLPLPNVTMSITEFPGKSGITSQDGAYLIAGLFSGTYTLSPRLAGYSFEPASRSVSLSTVPAVGLDFTGRLIEADSVSLTGNLIKPAGSRKTVIRYEQAESGRARVRIFSLLGDQVRTLNDGPLDGGRYTWEWDGKTDDGDLVGSGLYFLRVEGPKTTINEKIVVVR